MGRLEARLCQLQTVRSRHPGRYPKLEGSTLSHPAFEPLTEHHAFSTGLFNAAEAASIPSGTKRCCQCAWQHDKSVRTPSFGRIRFYRFFDRNSKSQKQRDQQIANPLGAAMLLASQFRYRLCFRGVSGFWQPGKRFVHVSNRLIDWSFVNAMEFL